MKTSDYIVKFLEAQGIEYVFGYQGGMVSHMVDSLSRSSRVKFIQCYHEQNAGFAAEGCARVSGKFGVCLVTSGPGAVNALTSVGNAYFDSVPVLYITGQVNTYEYKYGKKIRQQGFQETDIVSVARPICKEVFLADEAADLERKLSWAVKVMLSGRKGPVVMDLPMDVQRSEVDFAPPVRIIPDPLPSISSHDAEEIKETILSSKRPLVLCGGGIAGADANLMVRKFLRETELPYVVSLMGKGLVDETDSNCLGMIGSYGNRAANFAMSEADVVLALGSRLDLRQTGNRKSPALKNIRFIRVDVDREELQDSGLPNQSCYYGSVESLLVSIGDLGLKVDDAWRSRIEELGVRYSQQADVDKNVDNKSPYLAMSDLYAQADKNAIFVADVGQNQMWAAQVLKPGAKQSFLTSGGMAPMGYAISAAVGAAFATGSSRQIVCVCGDGGAHIGVQAMLLVSQYKLPVTIVIFNNRALGLITQFQRLYFDSKFAGTTNDGGYCVPEWKSIAEAYGLEYTTQGIRRCAIREIQIEGLTTVVPKLEYNRGLNDMSPSF